jgi:hypothetical protein
MNTLHSGWRESILAALVCLTCQLFVVAADESTLTTDQIKQFLLTAKVLNSHQAATGITHTVRLTLSDGTITHDASFQAVNERAAQKDLALYRVELNFVDSYKYNIAAYGLAELLGLDDIVPVYVERKWKGNVGSLSWWLPVKMDDAERYKKKIKPPDLDAWNNQMYKVRVLDQLVSDTDANLSNVLITENWKIWRIDFTRAFRLNKEPAHPEDLVRCPRELFEKLKSLDANALEERTSHYLSKNEREAVMSRRDKIVAQFQKMIAEKGENEVLY